MRITIHQPDFLPWMGFFDRWARSDLLILLDDVQFIRRGWQHRDKIKTSSGIQWLTVPVLKKGRYFQKINEVEIDNEQNWRQKHLHLIEAAYGQAPCFERFFKALQDIYTKEHTLLMSFNMDLLKLAASAFNIRTPVDLSSRHNIQASSTEKLLLLAQKSGGSVYLTGLGSKGYLDEALFVRHGITVEWQDYTQPVYPQLHGEFVANLSALDYLMMVGGNSNTASGNR